MRRESAAAGGLMVSEYCVCIPAELYLKPGLWPSTPGAGETLDLASSGTFMITSWSYVRKSDIVLREISKQAETVSGGPQVRSIVFSMAETLAVEMFCINVISPLPQY